MRNLREAPRELREAGEVQFGSFRGGLPRMDFGPVPHGRLWQLLHQKRWTYAAVADARVFAGQAVVSLGYAATAIVFVLDRERGELVVDRSTLGPGHAASFRDDGPGTRQAKFELGRTRLVLGDDALAVDLTADDRPTHVIVRCEGDVAPPISAVVPVQGGFANATEKRLARASGEIVAGGRRYVLDGALAAFDHTAGYLARHTAWRWALGLGFTSDGRPVGFNLVEGFVGEAECGAWLDGVLHPLGEGRFEYDAAHPERPWRVRTTCGGLDVGFEPAAVHAEEKDMLVVRSRFVQPIGAFRGTLDVGGEKVSLAIAGVTEHQDVLW